MSGIWDAATFATVKQLWNVEGQSATAIAGRIGTTRNAVLGKIYRFRDEFNWREPAPQQGHPANRQRRARVSALKIMAGEPQGARPRVVYLPGIDAAPAHKPAVVPAALTLPVCERVTFLAVSDRQCHWPMWSKDAPSPGADGLCCGAGIDFGKVYCGYHRAVSSGTIKGGAE